ncbi:MAG: addiction module antidote protein, HigA family [Rhizobiales bacterium 65-79]|jgi:addiction module HigA family antidote|nr:HigA family addiction module antidote protein [Hyphomicrobiales bacterium]OJU02639.1 MAG: addiction module antidote protein, HigA family [Rhizobiales bacterium 65-79]
MPMKAPPHPGMGIRDDIDALGLTIAEAAAGLGITRQQLYNLVNGRSGITPEMAVRLEKALGGSASHWMRLQNAYEIARIRDQEEINLRRLAPKVA